MEVIVYNLKLKEGAKRISFLLYDGAYGVIDKVLVLVDSSFGGKDFEDCSRLSHLVMHFWKSAHQWWRRLQPQGTSPHMWKDWCKAIM